MLSISLIALLSLLISSVAGFVPSYQFSPCTDTTCHVTARGASISATLTSSFSVHCNRIHSFAGNNPHKAHAFSPPDDISDATAISNIIDSSSNILLSDESSNSVLSTLPSVLLAGLVIAAAIFLYANVVYTPEIVQNAKAMREEEQATQLIELIQQLQSEGRDMDESRVALETVFGMSVGEYAVSVDAKGKNEGVDIGVSDAEMELVELLRSIYG
mmetsp:Transcript_1398/g.2993  ORF Transcript_1398/g.2993 Transcript_1398/m.2993 type:complete len:216 (+) Transcript_1398:63-710(+)